MSRQKPESDIELTYQIELESWSKKTIEEAAADMITGVTIGTMQSSEGTYTPKEHCLFGPNPGRAKGEVLQVEEGITSRQGTVRVRFPAEIAQVETVGFAGLFSVAAGDGLGTAYEMRRVRLSGIDLPSDVARSFPGPKFGSEGIRRLLGKQADEPLVALLLKPNTAQPSEHYALYAKEAALGGADYIKEDELQFNHPACPLNERVPLILNALKEARDKTGKEVLYAPNITANSQAAMIENARMVVKFGAQAVMINVMQVGLDSLRVLREADIGVPIHVHRAGHDNYTRGDVGVDAEVLSMAFRLGGADLIHTGPVFGNLYDPERVVAVMNEVTRPWEDFEPSLPILSRSTSGAIEDSLAYIATHEEIENPRNVMFLVDKGVYEKADSTTGSIFQAVSEFVNTVRNAKPVSGLSREQILRNQSVR